uniref:Predicted protein n=1 Tax=Hordeum vulgare subsp. vulgare TaxID=112509 RepID=F2E7K0_HORVV|nr:predicted protein [Hordeum vulgare subsp. vulgare]
MHKKIENMNNSKEKPKSLKASSQNFLGRILYSKTSNTQNSNFSRCKNKRKFMKMHKDDLMHTTQSRIEKFLAFKYLLVFYLPKKLLKSSSNKYHNYQQL